MDTRATRVITALTEALEIHEAFTVAIAHEEFSTAEQEDLGDFEWHQRWAETYTEAIQLLEEAYDD